MVMRLRDYRLRVWLKANVDGEKNTQDLIAFIVGGTREHLDTKGPASPLSFVGVYPEHSRSFPRHRVRLHAGRPPIWSIDFVVPEPEDDFSLLAKLRPLFLKNGWTVAIAEQLMREEKGGYESRLNADHVRRAIETEDERGSYTIQKVATGEFALASTLGRGRRGPCIDNSTNQYAAEIPPCTYQPKDNGVLEYTFEGRMIRVSYLTTDTEKTIRAAIEATLRANGVSDQRAAYEALTAVLPKAMEKSWTPWHPYRR